MVKGNQVFVSVEDGQEPFKVYLFEDYIEQFGFEPISAHEIGTTDNQEKRSCRVCGRNVY